MYRTSPTASIAIRLHSCSAGTLAHKYTHDLRAVQVRLRRTDPRPTPRYAWVIDNDLNTPGRGRTDSSLTVKTTQAQWL